MNFQDFESSDGELDFELRNDNFLLYFVFIRYFIL